MPVGLNMQLVLLGFRVVEINGAVVEVVVSEAMAAKEAVEELVESVWEVVVGNY